MDDQTSRIETTPPTGAPPPSVPPTTSPPPSGGPGASGPGYSAPPPPPPAWRPPPHDSGRNASFVFGVIILLVGLWFFATHTLGLDLPRIEWDQLWPLVLIGIGALIVWNAFRRRAR